MVDGEGKPVSFLDVHVPAHLAFYRAGIAAITDEEPTPGCSSRCTARGSTSSGTAPTRSRPHARARGAEARRRVRRRAGGSVPERMAEAGVDDELRLADYHRLQWADRFSLAFCLRELGRARRAVRGRVVPLRAGRPRGGRASRRGRSPRASSRARSFAGSCRSGPGARPSSARRSSRSPPSASRSGSWRSRGRGRAPHLAPRPDRRGAPTRDPRALAALAREARLRPERAAALRAPAGQPARLERLVRRGDEGRLGPDEGRARDDRRRRLGRERLRLLHRRTRRRAAEADEGPALADAIAADHASAPVEPRVQRDARLRASSSRSVRRR